MPDLTVFTVANSGYEPFVLPYLTSVLCANPTAAVEICLPDPRIFSANNETALGMVGECFPDRLLLRGGDFHRTTVNSLRFLETPRTAAPYLYIGDIDILVLEEIAPGHIDHMARTGLRYSNTLRNGGSRLTGLHFTEWDAHVPLTDPPDGTPINLDERLLHDLVQARGLGLPDPADTFRPLHGYHLSLNCDPRMSGTRWWGGTKSAGILSSYLTLQRGDVWQELAPLFDVRYRVLLALLETFLAQKEDLVPSPGTDLKSLWGHIG